ncbi:inositol 2-dehydrogenase-like isoform X2 [Glandiceps talaboti]
MDHIMTETKNYQKKLGFALFGLGRAGTIHTQNIIANYRTCLKWVVEEDLDKAQEFVKKYYLDDTQVASTQTICQVLEDNSVDAVIVCTPTHTHEQIVRAALKAGKSVFCEKPIATTIESTQSCYDDAETYNKTLYCAFNRRFDPAVRNVRKRARAGDIGQIQQIKMISRDSPKPSLEYLKISGGIFHDCGIHDIDAICWIVGEAPQTVFALGHTFDKDIAALNDYDSVNITMKFPSGVVASIFLSRLAAFGYDQRLEVFGSEGMLVSSNASPKGVTFHGANGAVGEPIHHSFAQRYDQSYQQELDHFIDVTTGVVSTCEVNCKDTIQASLIAEACQQSCRLGKPIQIVDGKMIQQ